MVNTNLYRLQFDKKDCERMSDYRIDYTTVRPFPPTGNPSRLRRTQSHIPGGVNSNQRPATYHNTCYSNKNRPRDGLLPSPRLNFNRMYSATALRIPVPTGDIDRSRSPSPAPQIHFTPIHHTHDMSLPVKRDATQPSPCATTNVTAANSVPSKSFHTQLVFPSNINFPVVCSLVPTVHQLAFTTPCPDTQGNPHSATGRLPVSEKLTQNRLSKNLIPEFRDGSHSPEPSLHLSPSSSSNELKRGYRSHCTVDSDYESCSSGSNTGLHSPVETSNDIDSYTPSVVCGSDRSSGCSSPSLSDSDSALNAPTRNQDSNRSLRYKTDSEHFFTSSSSLSSSSSSSPEPNEYPREDVLFIDNNKLPNTPHRSSPVTTPCSSHVYQLPGGQLSQSLQRHSAPLPVQQYNKNAFYPQETGRHSYSHPHSNTYRHNNGHQKRKSVTNNRNYQYNNYLPQTDTNSCFFLLSMEMWRNSTECKQDDCVILAKRNYCEKLTACIEDLFNGVQFYIVGSSMNGFSTSDCDLDLCMMTPNHPTSTRQEVVDRLYQVSYRLREKKIGRAHQVITAKTPIIKFSDPESGFEVDISVNNQHGIRNTNLLRTYSELDNRVRPLIVLIKQWAKRQQISNARMGTLSSYSLTLMVIFYLQSGCSPAVLPSLQELSPEYFDNWEIYPPDHLDSSKIKWASSNYQHLADLLLGFFKFYTEFNYQNVMSVRTASIIPPSYDQLGFIRIEEPYTRENVAHSVSRPWCFTSIKSHLHNAYMVLYSSDVSSIEALYSNRPIPTIPSSYSQNYYQ